jgi:isopenicillin-N N-acyltransferase-like protein
MDKMKEIPVIDLSGSPYEIGYQHGSGLKEKIISFHNSIYDLHLHNLMIMASRDSLQAYAMRNIGYLKNYSAKLFEELRGIADGCGLSLEDIVFLNSFLELEDLRPPELGAKLINTKLWGCTSFNVLPSASRDGRPYIGQTYDMERYYSKYNVILRIYQDDGTDQLVCTLAGVLGLGGINSRGIALSINKLVANDAREGVSYPFIVRKALDQKRIGDTFGAVVFASRATGMNYQLASEDGVAWTIECSAGYYDLLPNLGATSHTNHYLSPKMHRYETKNWLTHGGSYVRHQVSSRILGENIGKIDLPLLMEITRNHTNYPRCICAHGFDGQNEMDAFSTIFAVIYDIREHAMYACHENPCTNSYMKVDL